MTNDGSNEKTKAGSTSNHKHRSHHLPKSDPRVEDTGPPGENTEIAQERDNPHIAPRDEKTMRLFAGMILAAALVLFLAAFLASGYWEIEFARVCHETPDHSCSHAFLKAPSEAVTTFAPVDHNAAEHKAAYKILDRWEKQWTEIEKHGANISWNQNSFFASLIFALAFWLVVIAVSLLVDIGVVGVTVERSIGRLMARGKLAVLLIIMGIVLVSHFYMSPAHLKAEVQNKIAKRIGTHQVRILGQIDTDQNYLLKILRSYQYSLEKMFEHQWILPTKIQANINCTRKGEDGAAKHKDLLGSLTYKKWVSDNEKKNNDTSIEVEVPHEDDKPVVAKYTIGREKKVVFAQTLDLEQDHRKRPTLLALITEIDVSTLQHACDLAFAGTGNVAGIRSSIVADEQ